MRLIDADALEKEGWSLHRTIRVDMNTEEYQTKPLKQVPTIEPEQIVRCKDCKYYHDSDGCFFSTAETEENGFCSWAERKDGSCHST